MRKRSEIMNPLTPAKRFAPRASLALTLACAVFLAACGKGLERDDSPLAVVAPASTPVASAWAQHGTDGALGLSLVAGDIGGDGSLDGQGVQARFSRPADVAVDEQGNVYVADMANETVRKITPDGMVSTLAGKARESGDANGLGPQARFYTPSGIAVDRQGNVYVTDGDNHVIRKLTPQGVVSVLAGTSGESGFSDGPALKAQFNSPAAVAVADDGTVFVADSDNHLIRKISRGIVSTIAGSPGHDGAQDGIGSRARFSSPQGLTLDKTGTIYVADSGNDTLRKVTPSGVVSTLAGKAGESGHKDGTGSVARFDGLMGLRVDGQGVIWVVDGNNHVIRQVTPQGQVSTWAGGVGKSGSNDGPAREARFNSPSGMALDAAGNVYVADTFNEVVRKITPAGDVSTLAGWAPHPGKGNGTAEGARFDMPQSVAMDSAGVLYVADRENHTIRKVMPSGMVTTLAGQAGESGDDDGKGAQAAFNTPQGLTVDGGGKVIVADSHNDTLRQITPQGVVTTLAGRAGDSGATDGPIKKARFNTPVGVRVDAQGNLYVVDFENHLLRKISAQGVVSTLAGEALEAGNADGPGAQARLNEPADLVVDEAGVIYVADHGNHTIRKVTPDGVVSTFAGVAGETGFTDGPGSAARFHHPQGLSFDDAGNLYVADLDNHAIRKITPDGTVSTVMGRPTERGIRLGGQPRLDSPTSVTWVGPGRLVILSNHAVLLATVPAR